MASRMSKKTRLILIIVIIAVGAIVGIALTHSSCSPSSSTLQYQNAPDFTLPTMTGANITLAELEGTPIVLNFWATTCPACVGELSYFEVVAQESEGEIKVIVINVGQSISEVERFFDDYEPTMMVALDGNMEVFQTYSRSDNARGYIPITLLVDSEGIVQYIKIGAFQSNGELWDALDSVFEL